MYAAAAVTIPIQFISIARDFVIRSIGTEFYLLSLSKWTRNLLNIKKLNSFHPLSH